MDKVHTVFGGVSHLVPFDRSTLSDFFFRERRSLEAISSWLMELPDCSIGESITDVADFQKISETTESTATLQTVSAFWYLFFSLVGQTGGQFVTISCKFTQDTDWFTMDIASRNQINRNKSPIHLESFVLSLLPLTTFTHLGFAMVTLISSSKRLNIGPSIYR